MNISQAEYTHTHTHAKCGLLFKKFHWPTLIYLKGGKYQFVKLCVWIKCKSPSCARFFATPWTAAHQALLSMNFPGKNTREGCHFLLQRIFPTQGSNPGLLHCRQILYRLSYKGSPNSFWGTSNLNNIESFIPIKQYISPVILVFFNFSQQCFVVFSVQVFIPVYFMFWCYY